MFNFPQRPFSIRMFVPDGDPDGLRLVEKSNWTGIGVVFKRTAYKQVVARPEFDRTGVYVLVGFSEESALPTVYIGEGDPVKERLNQHYSKKEFWEWAVFFATKDDSLNKAHVKHLESRLLALAHEAKQCRLDNGCTSNQPTLSEAERADMECFLLDMLSIFPLLGLGIFEKIESKSKARSFLYIQAKGIKARGYEDAKGFVVAENSEMVLQETNSIQAFLKAMRSDLIAEGVVELRADHYVFLQDYAFGSPSTAAGVILGASSNGRDHWKNSAGKSLKEIQSIATGEEE